MAAVAPADVDREARRAQLVDQLGQVNASHERQREELLLELEALDLGAGELIPPRIRAAADLSRAAYYVMAAVVAIFTIAAAVVQRHIERDHAAPLKSDVISGPVAAATAAPAGRPIEGERL